MTFISNKSLQETSKSDRTDPILPIENKALAESLLDTTNLPIAIQYYYPSDSGALMVPFKDVSFTGKFIIASGTIIMTLEVTNDEDLVAPDWIDVTKLGLLHDNTSGNASVTITNSTLKFAIMFKELGYKYYRVRVDIVDDATNTVIIKQRRKAS